MYAMTGREEMEHELKIKEQFAEAIRRGDKNFEIRYNDRGFQKGDTVRFQVTNEYKQKIYDHPLNGRVYAITYVLCGWGVREGYVAFGIREIMEAAE